MKWVCYLIRSASADRTYVGITKGLHRRLRQHDGALKGGAKATRGKGPWELVCCVADFPDGRAARQFEWRMHHPAKRGRGLRGRLRNLEQTLTMERWTKNAPPADDMRLRLLWNGPRPAFFRCPPRVCEAKIKRRDF